MLNLFWYMFGYLSKLLFQVTIIRNETEIRFLDGKEWSEMNESCWPVVSVTCPSMVLAGCSKSTQNTPEGALRIYLADAPTQYDAVNIAALEVLVHMAG
jgi:hypothetical protein